MNETSLRVSAPDPNRDVDALIALLDFDDPGIGDVARDSRILHSHYDWQAARVGFVGDELVTHYGIYNLALRIGTVLVPTAGVNMVVTHPDYRGRGLMRLTATAATTGLRSAGYHMSLVCNAIEDFYWRFGYVFGWPEIDAVVKVDALPSAPPDLTPVPCVREPQPIFADVYNRDNAGVTGTARRPTFSRGKHPRNGSACCWNDETGALAGYMLYDIYDPMRTLWHDDSAGDAEQRLRVVAQLARQHDCVDVRFERLAPRSVLGRRLGQLTGRWERKTQQNGGWMVQIHNLPALCACIAPELARRLHNAGLRDWRGDLLLADAHEHVALRINGEQITVGPPCATPHQVNAGAHLAQFVVGTAAPDALAADAPIEVRGDARWLLPILFPAQDPQLSNDDL